ncbi:hypothetical protein LEP1GSC029_4262 [Leptospira interrogans str. 2002000626]|uniref:Uncharacterized protein n=1 Tax=Leptospira interrogans str. 2002000626 TaxID=996803 RepID=A0A829D3A9_LEPIR|nr:hypothetical protein LEP1GSC029_4262 [Leptospira interrogans str. 2002000626]
MRIYQPDVRRATVIYFFFCIGISFLSFLLPDGAFFTRERKPNSSIFPFNRLTFICFLRISAYKMETFF